MSKKITYLFGAGASFGTIPIVGQFNESFSDFARNFKEDFSLRFPNLCNDLRECADTVATHSTVDTYAKVLFFSGDHDRLRKLKYFLSLYFYFEQRSKPCGARYDLFLAAIMGGYQGSPKLPSNIRVLSWNYDNQLELSAAKFFKCNNIHQVRQHLPTYPAFENLNMRKGFYDGFLFHKLNGSAELALDQIRRKVVGTLNLRTQNDESVQKDADLVEHLNTYNREHLDSMLHYSWEDGDEIGYYREKALESIEGTEILVVIGYSFPTFNRDIDKTTLSSISKSLKKVYVQAPAGDVDESITRIKALSDGGLDGKVHAITSLNEFYVPFEFEGVY